MKSQEYIKEQIENHPINTVPLRITDFVPVKGLKNYKRRFEVYDEKFDISYLVQHKLNKALLTAYNVTLGAASIYWLISGLEKLLK